MLLVQMLLFLFYLVKHMLAIIFLQIDPVIFKIGVFSIKWYGAFYALSLWISLYFIGRFSLTKKIFLPLEKKHIDSLSMHAIIGIILGGRVGYVIFYRPHWFLTRPLMVLNTLEGGMSFHGALIGIIIAVFFLLESIKYHFFI